MSLVGGYATDQALFRRLLISDPADADPNLE
jgi:hypothetical protein